MIYDVWIFFFFFFMIIITFGISEFQAVLAWQSRIWKLVTEFIQLKTSNNIPQEQFTPEKIEEYNESIRESRNYFLKEVSIYFFVFL